LSGGAEVASGYEPPETYEAEFDAVVTRVLNSFLLSATPMDLAYLAWSRDPVPRDIDRALLTDQFGSLGVHNLQDPARFRLRDRVWDKREGQQ
jgi:hypothetical protein